MPKIFNVIVVHDVYAVAESQEAAVAAVKEFIRNGELKASETALPIHNDRNIRDSWREERPVVGSDVSDEDFDKLKGKTTIDIYADLYTKQPNGAQAR